MDASELQDLLHVDCGTGLNSDRVRVTLVIALSVDTDVENGTGIVIAVDYTMTCQSSSVTLAEQWTTYDESKVAFSSFKKGEI